MSKTVVPFGEWPSPITAASIAAGGISIGEPMFAAGALWWVEGRPQEKGRSVLVRMGRDAIPAPYASRTRVHEYGGGSYVPASDGTFAWFVNFADQAIYRTGDGAPERLTQLIEPVAGQRFADMRVHPSGRRIGAVRELHGAEPEARNEIVTIDVETGEVAVVASGRDFYSSPRWSPDGSRLAYLCWDHPNMPWDGTELRLVTFGGEPAERSVAGVPGGGDRSNGESLFQPEWSQDGTLHWISDRSGWWNLYSEGSGALCPYEADFGAPAWVFGTSTYCILDDGAVVCTWGEGGQSHLGVIPAEGTGAENPARIDVPFTSMSSLVAAGERVALLGGSAGEAMCLAFVDPGTGAVEVVQRTLTEQAADGFISVPRSITYPTGPDAAGPAVAHALYYPPAHPDCEGPAGERPPIVVKVHGGPTGSTSAVLRPQTLYWTSRGFAVVDVNYRGSTGFGRAYRRELDGEWGIADVEDCVAAVRYLDAEGLADASRSTITGGSAGGYTVLCALAFHDTFAAGASHYGVADAELLAVETHKFESRYLDGLIGPYPEAQDVYAARSPIHFVDQIEVPVILFQGLEDMVVPPSQATGMAATLRELGRPYAHLEFAGEQHGFRQATTIVAVLEAELSFYGQVFGLDPPGVERIAIENLGD